MNNKLRQMYCSHEFRASLLNRNSWSTTYNLNNDLIPIATISISKYSSKYSSEKRENVFDFSVEIKHIENNNCTLSINKYNKSENFDFTSNIFTCQILLDFIDNYLKSKL
jgi:hypothetical protein